MTIRVLICDDHQLVRRGIRQALDEADDIAVGGEAADGPSAVQQLRAAAAAGAPLDVVLMDIAMPQRDGLDVLKQLKAEFPKLPVLMLSTYPDRQYAVRALKLGAAGYLNKSADAEQLTQAVRRAAAGKLFITPSVAEQLAQQLSGPADADALPLHERLSNREYQVFRLLATGRSVGEIAEQLALSSNTVSTYRARVLDKTGVRNDVELALYAVQHGLLGG
jgi:two-component system, NarL family, invasion response regulator UvrY